MRALALTLETIAGHTSTESKVQAAAAYLASQGSERVAIAARFLAGVPLPPGTPATKVGRSTLVDVIAAFSGAERRTLLRQATTRGDLGTAVAELLDELPRDGAAHLPLDDVAATLHLLGQVGRERRSRLLRQLFRRASPLEAKYLTKLLLGSLRTGMQASRVEEAIALAFNQPLRAVRRAHMLLGDVGATAARAAANELDSITLRAHRPVRMMLAYPAETAADILTMLPEGAIAEDKYDGIRAQWHFDATGVRIYSRALEDFTHFFPEIRTVPQALAGEWILDGEVVAWLDGQALSFGTLQRRLGRKQVPLTLLLDAPVIFLAFDVLRAEGVDLIDASLRHRKRALQQLPEDGPVRRAPWTELIDEVAITDHFASALAAGNEGAVFKDPESTYQPGSRGRAWIKLKRPLGTLDVVVTGAEWGRGKRAGLLSDLIFAVRGPAGLVDVGRAYSGLTDVEIGELTSHFKENTVRTTGSVRRVTPDVVLEVAFDDVRPSTRHPAGFALRFPRIVRRRHDLEADEVSTLADLSELYARAQAPEIDAS
jgi:DNA ligase-1